jgi:hypothetical protein
MIYQNKFVELRELDNWIVIQIANGMIWLMKPVKVSILLSTLI